MSASWLSMYSPFTFAPATALAAYPETKLTASTCSHLAVVIPQDPASIPAVCLGLAKALACQSPPPILLHPRRLFQNSFFENSSFCFCYTPVGSVSLCGLIGRTSPQVLSHSCVTAQPSDVLSGNSVDLHCPTERWEPGELVAELDFFCGPGNGAQDLVHAGQVPYHRAPAPVPQLSQFEVLLSAALPPPRYR